MKPSHGSPYLSPEIQAFLRIDVLIVLESITGLGIIYTQNIFAEYNLLYCKNQFKKGGGLQILVNILQANLFVSVLS